MDRDYCYNSSGCILALSCVIPAFGNQWKTYDSVYHMAAKSKLSLKEAQSEFTEFLSKINPQDIAPFLQWVGYSFSTRREDLKPKFIRDASEKIIEIAEHLRQRLHVDCFLFDDQAVDDLVSQGALSRNYCISCGSKNTKELTFISHSLAPSQLEFIFTEVVPLKSVKQGFNVVDIGSRLGSVIYAAHLYGCGNASVTGIELNEDFCRLQESVISEFNLQVYYEKSIFRYFQYNLYF
uniref:Methyltranfer_dom domain-containing protein n=1 Tax=Heterorhabditis bacteriophora TaxID=37862 RepID=A0A1I7X3U8_HETBA